MPIIENYADHDFEFPIEKWTEDGARRIGGTPKLVFRKLSTEVDKDTHETKQLPGTTEVTPEQLKLMKDHPVAKSWFDRNALVLREGGAPPDKKQRAA